MRSHRDKKLRSQNRLGEEAATERSYTKKGKELAHQCNMNYIEKR